MPPPKYVTDVKSDQNRSSGYGAVGGGSKMAIPYYFGQWLIQQLVLP